MTAEIKAGVVDNPDIKSVVMCGIETHACIHHTTLELMEAGKDVHIVVDCCSSRWGHCPMRIAFPFTLFPFHIQPLHQVFFHRFCGFMNNRISETLSLGEKSFS